MKTKLVILTCLLIMLLFTACMFNESESKVIQEASLGDAPTNEYYNLNNLPGEEKNRKPIRMDEFSVFEEQSFWVDLENWGKVRFVSGCYFEDGKRILKMSLIDQEQNLLYLFSDLLEEISWELYEVRAISLYDVNKDGEKDIIVIADYITGVGSTGAIPFPVAGIYFQKGKEFIRVKELDEKIVDFDSIDKIIKLVEGVEEKEIKLNS